MELTSPSYFAALAALFLLYWPLPQRGRVLVLLAGSYALYALWDLRYLLVLVASTALDFALALVIERTAAPRRRRLLFLLSLVSNLGILGFFKYAGFFASTLGARWPFPALFIPLGVSFYTFHSISYVTDVFRGKISACRDPVLYALYVSYFPKLVAGPIERTEKFFSQLLKPIDFNPDFVVEGFRLFAYGLFLKLAVGDRLGFVVDRIFASADTKSVLEHWLGFYSYAFKIFADFYGYTLIARGASLFFGIRLSPNFLAPYWSVTPREFWRRWHISLSTWFRDYVYIPLGGNHRHRYRNVLTSMALAGLWHGADLRFVFWGLYHGALLVLELALFGEREPSGRAARACGRLVTFHLVAVGWIFFQAKSFALAISYLRGMFSAGAPLDTLGASLLSWSVAVLVLWALVWGVAELSGSPLSSRRLGWFSYPLRGLSLAAILLAVMIFGTSNADPFVYYYF
jgi:alginate O-acetyltransferase complex protein AlgI